MKKWFLVVIILFSLISNPTMSQNNTDPMKNEDGYYRIEIVAQRFNFTLIDLNRVDDLIDNGISVEDARMNSILDPDEISFEKGTDITLIARSKDVAHGVLISNLNVDLFLPQAEEGDDFGEQQSVSRTLPDFDYTLTIYCNEYCGEGHSSMVTDLIVGKGGNNLPNLLSLSNLALILYVVSLLGIILFVAFLIRHRSGE